MVKACWRTVRFLEFRRKSSVGAASRETANGRKLRSSPKSSPTQRTEMHKKAGRGVKADLTGKLDNRSQINCGQVQILYDIQARQLKDQSRDNTWPGTALSEMIRKPNIFKYQYSAVPCQHSAKRLQNEISSFTCWKKNACCRLQSEQQRNWQHWHQRMQPNPLLNQKQD